MTRKSCGGERSGGRVFLLKSFTRPHDGVLNQWYSFQSSRRTINQKKLHLFPSLVWGLHSMEAHSVPLLLVVSRWEPLANQKPHEERTFPTFLKYGTGQVPHWGTVLKRATGGSTGELSTGSPKTNRLHFHWQWDIFWVGGGKRVNENRWDIGDWLENTPARFRTIWHYFVTRRALKKNQSCMFSA